MGDDSFVEAQEDSEREELYRRVAVFRRKFETEVGWTVYSDSDGIRTLFKPCNSSPEEEEEEDDMPERPAWLGGSDAAWNSWLEQDDDDSPIRTVMDGAVTVLDEAEDIFSDAVDAMGSLTSWFGFGDTPDLTPECVTPELLPEDSDAPLSEFSGDRDGEAKPVEEEKEDCFNIRVEGEVNTPVFFLLALLNEVDKFPDWMGQRWGIGVKQCSRLKERNAVCFLASLVFGLPPPFSDREFIFQIDGVDCMDKEFEPKQVACLINSVSEFMGEPVDVKKDRVKGVLDNCVILLTPKDRGVTLVQILLRVDIGLQTVPQVIIDQVMKTVGHNLLTTMRQAKEMTASHDFQQRISKRGDPFYDFIRRRIEQELPHEYLPPLAPTERPSASSGKHEVRGSAQSAV